MATFCPFTLLALILCFCAVAEVTLTTAKAFYCRDPDTGKLYPVNSTWHSTSFCGIYTCKLRKKSQEKNKQQSLPQAYNNEVITINDQPNPIPIKAVFRKNCSQSQGKEGEGEGELNTESFLYKNYEKKEKTYINEENSKTSKNENIEREAFTSYEDRYLTKEEIAALSLLLQTMKKSDLEAILEVYNLAQDIYKEIDSVTDVKNGPRTTSCNNTVKNNYEKDFPKSIMLKVADDKVDKKPPSYWYEPLGVVNSKTKQVELHISPQAHYVEPPALAAAQVPKPKTTTAPPKLIDKATHSVEESKTKQRIFEIITKQNLENPFLKGQLTNEDLRQMPYYHALSNFVNQASYSRPVGYTSDKNHISYLQSAAYPPSDIYETAIDPQAFYQPAYRPIYPYQQKDTILNNSQQQKQSNVDSNHQIYLQPQEQQNSEKKNGKQCCQKERSSKLKPWSKTMKKTQETNYNADKSFERKSLFSYSGTNKLNSQNLQLPRTYPQNFTLTSISNPYGSESWTLYNNKNLNIQRPSYIGHGYDVSRDAILDLDLSREVRDGEQELAQNMKDSVPDLAEWQTSPLALSVLNEVKANIAQAKFPPYPYRKKVRLEKVENLFRLNDQSRAKRYSRIGANSKEKQLPLYAEEYEVYIEKSMCQTDTEPGFFRIGNSSHPFPACCPQRIKT